MIYQGRVTAGVVVLEGEPPRDGTRVQVIAPDEHDAGHPSIASHPAVGIWKDRTDLPQDAGEAKRELGRKLMGRGDD